MGHSTRSARRDGVYKTALACWSKVTQHLIQRNYLDHAIPGPIARITRTLSFALWSLSSLTADCPPHPKQPNALRQNKHSSTFSSDAPSSTAVLSLAGLLANPSNRNAIVGAGKINPRRSSSLPAPRHLQRTPSSVPRLSIGLERHVSLHNAAVFIPANEASLVLSRHSSADDALHSIAPGSATSSGSSSPFGSCTTSLPLEQTVSYVSPLTGLLEALEREQLQEIYARGGFAGFTAQEIEGWVVAGRA